jgi:hypothetical protein
LFVDDPSVRWIVPNWSIAEPPAALKTAFALSDPAVCLVWSVVTLFKAAGEALVLKYFDC